MKYRGLFRNDPDPPRWEKVRVLKRGPEYTTLLVLRTASQPEPTRWHLLTKRLPDGLVEGAEMTIGFTPMELDWLRGLRDLPELPPQTGTAK